MLFLVMRAEQIFAHLRKQPCQAIRIFVSDGCYYDVRHPELVLVSQNEIAIALGGRDSGPAERLAYRDPNHITRIEPLNGRKPRRRALRK